MTPNSGATNTTLITFVVVVFVIVRFLYMELKARVVTKKTIWIRPAFLLVVSALLIWVAVSVPGAQPGLLAFMVVAGAVAGAFTGTLVVRFTTFSSAEMPAAVRAMGSTKTVVVWVVALAFRFVLRFAAPSGDSVQLALNAFTVVLITAAFVTVGLGFARAIDRYATGPEPAASV